MFLKQPFNKPLLSNRFAHKHHSRHWCRERARTPEREIMFSRDSLLNKLHLVSNLHKLGIWAPGRWLISKLTSSIAFQEEPVFQAFCPTSFYSSPSVSLDQPRTERRISCSTQSAPTGGLCRCPCLCPEFSASRESEHIISRLLKSHLLLGEPSPSHPS